MTNPPPKKKKNTNKPQGGWAVGVGGGFVGVRRRETRCGGGAGFRRVPRKASPGGAVVSETRFAARPTSSYEGHRKKKDKKKLMFGVCGAAKRVSGKCRRFGDAFRGAAAPFFGGGGGLFGGWCSARAAKSVSWWRRGAGDAFRGTAHVVLLRPQEKKIMFGVCGAAKRVSGKCRRFGDAFRGAAAPFWGGGGVCLGLVFRRVPRKASRGGAVVSETLFAARPLSFLKKKKTFHPNKLKNKN